MKEATAHINTPATNRTQPFFQRTADESREDSAFFSGVQAKLNIGAKDDPHEKEADAMADKVVNKKTIQAKLTVGAKDDPYEKEADAMADKVVNKKPGDVQMKAEEQKEEEKKEVEEEAVDNIISKKPVADDDNNENKVQRMCRECDEGDKVFLSADPAISGMSKRDAVIAMAKTMLGKIKAKQSGGGGERFGAKELWEIFKLAAPGIWSEEDIKTLGKPYPSWCGIFSVWAHKKAGIDLGNWQMGKGVTAFGTLKPTNSPQPGDIGYIHEPFQHHCIVTKVNGDTIDSIDGNSGWFSEVIENTRPRTAYTGFFTAFSGSAGATINKKENQTNSGNAPSSVESSLASSKGGGMGLPEKTRSEMESGFGADFSNVKIHTDTNAAQMSKDLNAQAFTHGNDIYFNENKYDTESKTGKQLLAHELTHTIQQGAAGVRNKDSTEPTKASGKIQKKPITSADIEAPVVVGNMYEITLKEKKLRFAINLDDKELEMPLISLPGLKQRNEKLYKLPILSVRGRGETLQVENWINAVKSVINAKVHDFLLKQNPGLNETTVVYYKLKKKKDFHLIGPVKKIQELSYIPKWGRTGFPNNHQVDHIVEHQLGGADQPGTIPSNYELLDSKANMSSGNAIRQERYRRINEALGYFRDINADKAGTFPNLPTAEEVKDGYINKFAKVADWKLPYNGEGKIYWNYDELNKAAHLEHLEKMTPAEINDIQGSAAEALIYVGEGLGTPKRLKIPFSGKKLDDFYQGMDLINFTIGTAPPVTGTPAGSIEFTLNQKFTKRLKAGDNLKFDLMPVESRLNTFYIKTSKQFNKNMFTKFEGLSPVTINDLQLDDTKGLMLTGTITSDLNLLKGLSIDFYLAAGDMGFSTFIGADFIGKYFPKPFNVTNAGLEISYSSKNNNLNLIGIIDFGIEKLGKGSIKAGKNKDGFMVSGDFIFDKSLFNGKIHFNYSNDKWTIGGSASMDAKKIKGIKNANINFEYSQEKENLHVGGDAILTVPGISKVTIDTNIGKNGDFEVTADVTLENIPRVKSGKVKVTIGKKKPPATQPGTAQPEGGSEWDLSIDGTIEPDLNYAGLTTKATFSYAKGAYDISITGSYKRGKIHAEEIKVGLTNKKVSADGKIIEGEPTKDMTFYGHLTLSVAVMEGDKPVKGTIESDLKPDGDITLDGKVELADKDIEIFSISPLNKDIPPRLNQDIILASCGVVTLSVNIAGGVSLYANLKPLSVKKGSYVRIGNLSLKKYNDPHLEAQILLGSHLSAGIKLDLTVSLVVSLLLVLKGSLGIKGILDFTAIDADATGNVKLGWSPTEGFQLKEASLSLQMLSKLVATLKGKARIYADLWLTEIDFWTHEWELAKVETIIASFFSKEPMEIAIEAGSDGKLKQPDTEKKLSKVKDAGKLDKIKDTTNSRLDGDGKTAADKKAEMQEEVTAKVKEIFTNEDRFEFNKTDNYLETRYAVYDYIIGNMDQEQHLDFKWMPDFIRQCEHEEYDRFSDYIINLTGFDDDSKAIIIEDFIVNHPTLYEGEIINLRSLIPAKAPPSPKTPVKTRGSKKTKPAPTVEKSKLVQAKAKAGGTGKKNKGAKTKGKKTNTKTHNELNGNNDGNEQMDIDDSGLMPYMEISDVNDFYNCIDEAAENDSSVLTTMNGFEEAGNNEDNDFKPFYMRPFTRTRKPLQQRAEEKSKPFFSGPDKKEKKANNAFFQAKLNVGETDDPLEKEADRVADAVTGKGVQKEERKEDIAKGAGIEKPEQEANKGKTPGADKPAIADKAAMQEEKKEKIPVQRKESNEKDEETNTPVNKKDNAPGHTASKANSVETAIGQKNGKGESIPANTLQEMQTAFGSDFSDVRIHTDSEAATLSNELDAQAFTTGKDIYFNTGKFDPDSESGKHLLAHELTHVLQQNKDSIQRDPKNDKEEKDRAQKVRDNYQKALKAKTVNWEEVALYFNAFNTAEQHSKMAQLNGNQLFRLHQGAVNAAGVGPWSAAALITTPIPGMESAVAAAIEEKMIGYNYQEAIDLMIEYLDKKGIIDRTLLWGGTMRYLYKDNLHGEGRILAPGFDQTTGKAKPTSANIGSDAFRPSTGLPLLYSTIIHEYQHVQQMQKKDESKALVPDQGNDDNTHLQQEVEAYATELVRAKESGLFNNPEEVEGAWNRLQSKWEGLSDDRKKILNDIYKKAYTVAKEALGKKSFLVYTPLK